MAVGPVGDLVLLRHGESEWNARNLFTGWIDIDLSAAGRVEAVRAGELLRAEGLLPEVVHTSVLRRAIRTAEITLEVCDRLWVPVRRSWRLNERHYGALQGKDKAAIRAEFGDEQFMRWRRSYDEPPPPLPEGDGAGWADDRYADLPPDLLPRTECLRDVVARLLPYWYDVLVPELRRGRTVLVVAHGNSMRAMIKHLDRIDDATIPGLNVPTGIPLLYRLDAAMRPIEAGGRYLDPAAAEAGSRQVAGQGR
jgi:2,3-bisphosphoglycerate-dependent phosphoglycerate mutase